MKPFWLHKGYSAPGRAYGCGSGNLKPDAAGLVKKGRFGAAAVLPYGAPTAARLASPQFTGLNGKFL